MKEETGTIYQRVIEHLEEAKSLSEDLGREMYLEICAALEMVRRGEKDFLKACAEINKHITNVLEILGKSDDVESVDVILNDENGVLAIVNNHDGTAGFLGLKTDTGFYIYLGDGNSEKIIIGVEKRK